jgi:hypothetical protein
MMAIRRLNGAALAVLLVCGAASSGFAAGGGTAGASASTVASGAGSTTPGSASGTIGSAGSAAAGNTSASSLGVGAQSTTPGQTSTSIGVGGSASAPGGRTLSRSRVYDGKELDFGRSADTAFEHGGTLSRSVTRTLDYNGQLHSRTRSVARSPGEPPVRSFSGSTVPVGQ